MSFGHRRRRGEPRAISPRFRGRNAAFQDRGRRGNEPRRPATGGWPVLVGWLVGYGWVGWWVDVLWLSGHDWLVVFGWLLLLGHCWLVGWLVGVAWALRMCFRTGMWNDQPRSWGWLGRIHQWIWGFAQGVCHGCSMGQLGLKVMIGHDDGQHFQQQLLLFMVYVTSCSMLSICISC